MLKFSVCGYFAALGIKLSIAVHGTAIHKMLNNSFNVDILRTAVD
jgi:hypothetical protein